MPMKGQYGPTLGQLLAPRWHGAGRRTRWSLALAPIAVAAVIVAGVLTLENATYSHGGRLAFSFSYRDLYRVAPEAGSYVKLERRAPNGSPEDSLAVAPLLLPPYAGNLSGELPLFASGYIRSLRTRYPDFQLRAEGKSNIDVQRAYDIYFTTRRAGRTEFGRVVLYLPERQGAREGVAIVILTTRPPREPLSAPPEVAATGPLARPLRSFAFG